MKLGENIRMYRNKANLTQEQLGEKVGVSAQAVSKWESDSSLPDTSLLPSIADALSTTIDTLFGFNQTDRHSMLETMYRYQDSQPDDHASRVENTWTMLFHSFMGALWAGSSTPVDISAWTQSVQISWDECFAQGWNYPESPLFVMMKKPEEGWNTVLQDNERIRRLFAALGDKEVWTALQWLFTKKYAYRFLFPVLLRDTGLPAESEEKVKTALIKMCLICEKCINIDGKAEKMYEYYPHHSILALWVLAYNYLYRDTGYNWQQSYVLDPFLNPQT